MQGIDGALHPDRQLLEGTGKKLCSLLRTYTVIHGAFFALIGGQLSYLFFHFSVLVATFVLAVHLAGLFVTVCSYASLRIYLQAKKEERIRNLVDEFEEEWTAMFLVEAPRDRAYFESLSNGCCLLAEKVSGQEYRVYHFPFFGELFSSLLERGSCWLHWKDLHFFRKILLEKAVAHYIQIVRLHPIDLEAHAMLANGYVLLSGLYVDPRKIEGMEEERWIPPRKYTQEFKQTFRQIAERAIEEFKILNEYAPEDPWVHAQLAYSYCDLQMPLKEIKEYETILELCPDDEETLCRLGKLYFQQGLNAKGLRMYEQLKQIHPQRAEQLLLSYVAFAQDRS